MLAKYILFLLFICTITQAKCQNEEFPNNPVVPRSIIGNFFRNIAGIKFEIATLFDRAINAFKNALKPKNFINEGLFGRFLGRNDKITYYPEQGREVDDMNREPEEEIEVFNPREVSSYNYNKRFTESELLAKIFSDLCDKGAVSPEFCGYKNF